MKRTLLSILGGFSVCLLISAILGENPLDVLLILLRGSVGSLSGIGYSLYYATPLIFTGLAVAVAFHTGLFNIGAEGQLQMGALLLTMVCLKVGALGVVSIPFAILIGAIGGAIWGGLAGFIKAYRGAHEVLITILLNFVSYGLVSFAILNLIKNHDIATSESLPLATSYHLPALPWFGEVSPANWAFVIACFVAVLVHMVLHKTVWGFQIRLAGGAPGTARFSGVPVQRRIVQAMAFSGALAGLVATNEILGFDHKLREGFSNGYGFTGIAVALVGRGKPLGVVFAALLFGALHKGALDLDLDTKYITRDLAVVMQAIIILFLVVVSWKGLLPFQKLFKRRVKGSVS